MVSHHTNWNHICC